MLATLAWFAMVLWMMPDIVIHENVLNFPTMLLKFFLGSFMRFEGHVLDPPAISEFGAARVRRYTKGKRNGFMASRPDLPDLVQSLATQINPYTVCRDVDFLVADIPDTAEFTLTATQTNNLTTLVERHPDRNVFPLECTPDWSAGSGAGLLGALKTNSTRRYSKVHKRWLLPGERMLAHGLPVTPWAAASLGVQHRATLLAMPLSAQHKVAGNGMHFMSVFSMIGYALSS